jgi:hypothetical protein
VPTFRVYYAKDITKGYFAPPSSFSEADYVDTGEVAAPDLDTLVSLLNPPRSETFMAQVEVGGVHASLSPCDVARDEDGRLWQCALAGWGRLA